MKRLFLLLVILITASTVATAQFIQGGVKAGININSSDFLLKNGHLADQAVGAFKNNAGYHVGFMARVNLGGIYVQGDALYVRNSFSYTFNNEKMKVKENRLDLPVVLGLKLLFLRAYVGPRFDIDLGKNVSKTIGDANEIKTAFDNRWLGYQAGLGLDLFNKMSVDFSYNGYFKAPSQRIDVGEKNYVIKQKSRQYWITLGYYFGGGNKYKKNKE